MSRSALVMSFVVDNNMPLCVFASFSLYLQTVSMHIKLCHRLTPDVYVLDLFRGDVLALGQLEDVLLPVNYLQCAVLHEKDQR